MERLKRNLWLLLSLFYFSLYGQVSAPDFLCVKGDTLFWTNPESSSCGLFLSTDVYFSADPGTAFQLLASLTDSTINHYIHSSHSGPAFYYLITNRDCGSMIPIPSDTLGIRPKEVIDIRTATVQNQTVHVSWNPSKYPETIGYIIYRVTESGTIPVDTVFDQLFYIDMGARPDQQPEFYYVLALDGCGNTSAFANAPHKTIFLKGELNFCMRYIRLTWNKYQGWPMGIADNEIWLAFAGEDTLSYEHRVSGNDTLAFITNLLDETDYCIAIYARESGGTLWSKSNDICLRSDVLSLFSDLILSNVSVNSNQEIEVSWKLDLSVDLQYVQIFRGLDSKQIDELVHSYDSSSIESSNTWFDTEALSDQQPYFYQLKGKDICDNESTSNWTSSILLEVTEVSGDNLLSWTPGLGSDLAVTQYRIFEIVNGTLRLIGNVDGETHSFVHQIMPGTDNQEQYCYVVQAEIHAHGDSSLVSFSNTSCNEVTAGIYVPNAFVPAGANSIFKPEVAIVNNVHNYNMIVFNRWGGKVFESNSIQFGWDGSHNGKVLEPGVYFYIITIAQGSKDEEILSGTVHLIR